MGKFLRLIFEIVGNFFCRYDVLYVVEDADWVVKSEGLNYQKYMHRHGIRLRISITHLGARNRVVHFGAVSTLVNNHGVKDLHPSNRIILTWYHVPENDPRMNYLKSLAGRVSFLHTSCEISKKVFVKSGFPDSKIVIIPIPIDLEVFDFNKINKEHGRRKYDLPSDKFIIGSFQKDGDGWGEGMNPKHVKGPDLFCDAIENLPENNRLHVLLSGPSRGYVKTRLKKAGVSFTHIFLKDPSDVVELYSVIDAYVISSRVEGGPKALVESWALKVPLISTSVGMCADYGVNGVNIFMADECSGASISKAINRVLSNPKSPTVFQVIENAYKTVQDLSYAKCSLQWLNLYKNEMSKSS